MGRSVDNVLVQELFKIGQYLVKTWTKDKTDVSIFFHSVNIRPLQHALTVCDGVV